MNEDAFARRFYADRSELESLGIQLHGRQAGRRRRRAGELLAALGALPPPFDRLHRRGARLAAVRAHACSTASSPTPSRCGSRSSRSPGAARARSRRPTSARSRSASPRRPAAHELSQRLAKVETAIFRQKTITFDYFTIERDETGARKVDPYHLLFRDGQFYLLGYSHERDAIRVFRLSRIRGKVAYATKAERDFRRPTDFDPRVYGSRELAVRRRDRRRRDRDLRADRLAGRAPLRPLRRGPPRRRRRGRLRDAYANARQLDLVGARARRARPRRRARRARRRDRGADRAAARAATRASSSCAGASAPSRRRRRGPTAGRRATRRAAREAAIRPERFARLVTLASILIDAGRAGDRLRVDDVCERVQISDAELREDVNVLNVVNFGGGSYVLYAEIHDDGEIEVDPEPYSDNFDRPARLLPVEAKALIAAIDLIGDHLPEGALASAREKIVAALGADPLEQGLQVASGGGDDSQVARVVSKAISGASC